MSEQTAQFKTSQSRLEYARAYKERNKERIRAMNKARNDARRADPVAWEAHLARNRATAKARRELRSAYDKNRDRLKIRARNRVRDCIYRGVLVRGSCEVCGASDAHAHHTDYSKPLDVRWLCSIHHAEEHRAALAATRKEDSGG